MNDLPLLFNALSSNTLSDLFAEVSSTGNMTRLDCQHLRDVLLDNRTSNEEKQAIDRLLYAIRLGRIQVESHG